MRAAALPQAFRVARAADHAQPGERHSGQASGHFRGAERHGLGGGLQRRTDEAAVAPGLHGGTDPQSERLRHPVVIDRQRIADVREQPVHVPGAKPGVVQSELERLGGQVETAARGFPGQLGDADPDYRHLAYRS
ncbi:hypothetical protein [Amycolatopsis sp. WGS_07]|uniref:hypothetical protein n=1 Tax=Amycolatopsis sp. WGS_07 TaxID=3076764 RepID=UPI003873BE99